MIKLKDLEDVMTSYPNLRAQLLSMMDAADQNDLYEEVTLPSNLFLLLFVYIPPSQSPAKKIIF